LKDLGGNLTKVLAEMKKQQQVEFTVERERTTRILTAQRREVKPAIAESRIITKGGKRIGYVYVSGFFDPVGLDFLKELLNMNKPDVWALLDLYKDPNVEKTKDLFAKQALDGIILDFRGNPGGFLSFLYIMMALVQEGDKPIVTLQGNEDQDPWKGLENGEQTLSTPPAAFMDGLARLTGGRFPVTEVPMTVLIDGRSGSASEIAASALQANGRATIVGQKSAGACGAAQMAPLPHGAGMMVTVAKSLSPKGVDLEKNGVTPDVAVELKKEDIKNGKDTQLEKAIEILKNK